MFYVRVMTLFVAMAAVAGTGNGQVAIIQRKIGRVVDPNAQQTDKSALSSAKLKADDPDGLVAYFKQRTLTDAELTKIKAVISRMGSESFEDREKASADVLGFGPAAIGPLKTAARAETDPEVNYRAEQARKKIETVSHTAVAIAAARALAQSKHKHPQAVPALLGFLLLADDESVVEEIDKALVKLADDGGKPDPALLAALTDKRPIRRAAAVEALLDGGDRTKPVRFPDAIGPVKAALASDTDAEVKFRGLYLLLTRVKDKDAVEGMIQLLPTLPRGRYWQADDYLTQLAGKDSPKARFGKSKESQQKALAEWV
ncbi:MAG TPA: HEAT repeat domain-containing protein, partial [Fimbriiglobus sp.]